MSERLYTLEEVREIVKAHEYVVEALQDLDAVLRFGGDEKRSSLELKAAEEQRIDAWKKLDFSIPEWDIGE